MMKWYTDDKIIEIAEYIIKNKTTTRETAVAFKLSKSCIHRYVQEVLKNVSFTLYLSTRAVLDYNKSVRHLRGGAETKRTQSGIKRIKKEVEIITNDAMNVGYDDWRNIFK